LRNDSPVRGIQSIVTTPELPPHIVLYDGVCGLCNRSVSWLLARLRDDELFFAPLQGETAAALRARHAEIPRDLDSVVYVDRGRVHLRSKVFLHAAKHLRAPWRWAYYLRWLPGFALDLVYRLVARVRYRVWGKYEACQLPSTKDRGRLLP
jgi:predicted DCC family thiol-disulfide oxidoreductase YuxK